MVKTNKSTFRLMYEIFIVYFKAMLFAFTGGHVTLPIIQQEFDEKYKLIDKDKVLEYFAIGQAIPGVISLNAGIMIGRDICGWPGAFAAALGIVLPAFLGMLLVTTAYTFINEINWIKGAIKGIRAASIAIIMYNAFLIAKKGKHKWEFTLMTFSFFAVLGLKLSVLSVIIISGFIGIMRALYIKYRKVE